MPTPSEVAEWMLAELRRDTVLLQSDAAYTISQEFGEEFVYINENGNLAIAKPVLTAFQNLTREIAVWERGTRTWRMREPYDEPGRRQD